jgi:hypothetical protein
MIIPLNKTICITQTSMVLEADDSSTSSTVTAVLTLPKKSALMACSTSASAAADGSPPLIRARKNVRFNECANELFSNTQLCSEDCEELWYSGDEYVAFKATAKFMASQIAQHEQEQEKLDPFSYKRILLRTHEACRQSCPLEDSSSSTSTSSLFFGSNSQSVLTLLEEKHLRRWMQGAPMRLGLERYAIKDLGRDRYYRRKNLVQTVLHLQSEWHVHNIPITPEEQAECLSLASQSISRPSKLFSRHLAQAQAISFGQ